MNGPNVFITHAITVRGERGESILHDYSAAERFGTLRYVTVGRPDWGDDDSFLAFEGALSGFRPEIDYLLATGDPVAIAASVAAVVAHLKGASSFRLLAYTGHARSRGYVVVNVPIPHPAEAGEPQ